MFQPNISRAWLVLSFSARQEWRHRRTARPLSAWLLPACTPEPDGVVLYPDHCPSASSLPGPSYCVQIPARAEEAQSPVSGASVGYGSGGSSPDHRRHGTSDDQTSASALLSHDYRTRIETLNVLILPSPSQTVV